MNGLKHDAMADRRHLLDNNMETVLEGITRATCCEPVAIIADARDHHGRQFAIYIHRVCQGLSSDEATKKVDELVAQYEGKAIPTINATVSMQEAEMILPYTSPTATESLRRWMQGRRGGEHLVVVIATGGNTYATVGVPAVVKDGQNRCGGRL